MIGVKLRTNVCNTNIHFPFCDVGENLQRPFEISCIEEEEAEKVLVTPVPDTEKKINNQVLYRISSYSFRGNYCFLTLDLCTVTFDGST